jgi:sugar lactone lactonase YvrE
MSPKKLSWCRLWLAVLPAALITVLIGSSSGCSQGGGSSSSVSSSEQIVATPSISPAGGTFKYPQTVTISDVTAGATIYYTLNGSTPTTASMEYTAPVSVPSSLNLSAIAVAGGMSSAVATQTFTIETIYGTISTVAGDGKEAYNGDAIQATQAGTDPYGVAVDSSGNLYIADTGNQRIRMVNPAGVISTVAGNGTAGYSGDGGPATSAMLDDAFGIAVDGSGNLYIADYNNGRVRKVTPDGVISTVAGNGTAGYSGDGGPATSAEVWGPYSLAVDGSDNLYIADSANNRIRKVTPAGTISTVAGNGTAGYSGDGGAATSAQLWVPLGVAVDSNGNLYIADNYNNAIRKVTSAGVISTISQASVGLINPEGVAVDNLGGLLYVADTNNSRVLVMTPDGQFSTVAGNGSGAFTGDGGSSLSAQLAYPSAVAVDSVGNLYIADTLNYRIRKVTF